MTVVIQPFFIPMPLLSRRQLLNLQINLRHPAFAYPYHNGAYHVYVYRYQSDPRPVLI